MWELVGSVELDGLLRRTAAATFPAYEHESFTAYYRRLLQHWLEAEQLN